MRLSEEEEKLVERIQKHVRDLKIEKEKLEETRVYMLASPYNPFVAAFEEREEAYQSRFLYDHRN